MGSLWVWDRMCPTMGGLSLFPTTKFGGIHEKSEELNKHFPESDGIHDPGSQRPLKE